MIRISLLFACLLTAVGCQGKSSTHATIEFTDKAEKYLTDINNDRPEADRFESIAEFALSDQVLQLVARRLASAFEEQDSSAIVERLKNECRVKPSDKDSATFEFVVDTQPNGFAIGVLQAWIEETEMGLIKVRTIPHFIATETSFKLQSDERARKMESLIAEWLHKLPEPYASTLPSPDQSDYWEALNVQVYESLKELTTEPPVQFKEILSRVKTIRDESPEETKQGNENETESHLRLIAILYQVHELQKQRGSAVASSKASAEKIENPINPGGTYAGDRIIKYLVHPQNRSITQADIDDYRERRKRCPDLPNVKFK